MWEQSSPRSGRENGGSALVGTQISRRLAAARTAQFTSPRMPEATVGRRSTAESQKRDASDAVFRARVVALEDGVEKDRRSMFAFANVPAEMERLAK